MLVFKSENQAFKAAGDKVAALSLEGKSNCGFRILKADNGWKVLIVPARWHNATPYYLDQE